MKLILNSGPAHYKQCLQGSNIMWFHIILMPVDISEYNYGSAFNHKGVLCKLGMPIRLGYFCFVALGHLCLQTQSWIPNNVSWSLITSIAYTRVYSQTFNSSTVVHMNIFHICEHHTATDKQGWTSRRDWFSSKPLDEPCNFICYKGRTITWNSVWNGILIFSCSTK